MGASVDVVPAYETVKPEESPKGIEQMLKKGEIDLITFTSSSTVINFVKMFEGHDVKELFREVSIASIGPITAKTAAK